jgi:hypothetical protein
MYSISIISASLLAIFTTSAIASPVELTHRDLRLPGAKCGGGLYSTSAVDQVAEIPGTGPDYRICCPKEFPEGMMEPEGPYCCAHVSSMQYPLGCAGMAGTLLLPASVRGCEDGWKKKEVNKIKYCEKKR